MAEENNKTEEDSEDEVFEPRVKARLEQIIKDLQETPEPTIQQLRRGVIAALICVSVVVDYFLKRHLKPKPGNTDELIKEDIKINKNRDKDLKRLYV